MFWHDTDENECPFIVGQILEIIDNKHVLVQLYAPVSKKVKYGTSKFGKWHIKEDDSYLQEKIDIQTIVTDFSALKQDKIPMSILESISSNPTIDWIF